MSPIREPFVIADGEKMRLCELEVLEKIAAAGKLNIILGKKGLAHRVVNLL